MRTIITGDPHLNDKTAEDFRLSQQLLDDLLYQALEHKCRFIMLNGDVLHYKYGLNARVMVMLYHKMMFAQAQGVQYIIWPGNHDKYDESEPEFTVLSLLEGAATVITKPWLVDEKECLLFIMPWFPAPLYKRLVHAYSLEAMRHTHKPRIMLTHVSLAEGKVSASNERVEQPVRVADLHPEVWSAGIFCSDYHAHQTLSSVVMYLGAPRPMTFGDFNNVGTWLLEVSGGRVSMTGLPLPGRYPQFHSWRVDKLSDLPLPGYNELNHNRIDCPADLQAQVHMMYPTAKLQAPASSVPVIGPGRLVTEDLTPFQIFERWRVLRGLAEEPYRTLAMEVL